MAVFWMILLMLCMCCIFHIVIFISLLYLMEQVAVDCNYRYHAVKFGSSESCGFVWKVDI